MKHAFTVIVICLLTLGACPRGECEQSAEGGGRVLIIGLIPEQNIFKQLERYAPMAGYLTQRTGLKVELRILTRYGNIIDNFVSGEMDGAFLGSFSYALVHGRLGAEVLARPEGLDGSSTYHGVLFVRKDSGISGAKGMKGKRFAFVDRATTAGFLLPLAYFKAQGIRDYKRYFKEVYYAGTHEDAIYDVLRRKADVGAAKNTVFDRLAATDGRIGRELRILTTSPDVPENGLALRKTVEPAVKKAMQEALLAMHDDPAGRTVLKEFGARRFIRTTDADYEPVYRYARDIGLDLSRYDYVNE